MIASDRVALLALLTLAPLPAPAGVASDAGLSRCAAITATAERLQCYDALAGRSTASTAPAPAPASPSAPATTPALPVPPPQSASAAPAVQAPAAAVDPAQAEKNFGLSATQMHLAPQGPSSLSAHVAKVVVDPQRRGYVVLDNGQTWTPTDGEFMLNDGEAVTISRAALGSYMLVTKYHSWHVRRIR